MDDEVIKEVAVPGWETDEVVQPVSHTEDPKFVARVEEHEGFRLEPYKDSLGNTTIGIGHLVRPGENFGPSITEKQARDLFKTDLSEAERGAQSLPVYQKLNAPRQQVLTEMVFNMGLPTVKQFHRTLRRMDEGKFDMAADSMLKSKWARQVGQRAKTLAAIMKSGK